MNKKTYAEKLRDPRWQKKRLEILQRDHFCCRLCEDTETELHIHHLKYAGNPWDVENDQLLTLCKHCHLEVEKFGRMVPLADIHIWKIAGWPSGVRMMLSSYEQHCILRLYNASDELIIELGMDADIMSTMSRAFEFPLQKIHDLLLAGKKIIYP